MTDQPTTTGNQVPTDQALTDQSLASQPPDLAEFFADRTDRDALARGLLTQQEYDQRKQRREAQRRAGRRAFPCVYVSPDQSSPDQPPTPTPAFDPARTGRMLDALEQLAELPTDRLDRVLARLRSQYEMDQAVARARKVLPAKLQQDAYWLPLVLIFLNVPALRGLMACLDFQREVIDYAGLDRRARGLSSGEAFMLELALHIFLPHNKLPSNGLLNMNLLDPRNFELALAAIRLRAGRL